MTWTTRSFRILRHTPSSRTPHRHNTAAKTYSLLTPASSFGWITRDPSRHITNAVVPLFRHYAQCPPQTRRFHQFIMDEECPINSSLRKIMVIRWYRNFADSSRSQPSPDAPFRYVICFTIGISSFARMPITPRSPESVVHARFLYWTCGPD